MKSSISCVDKEGQGSESWVSILKLPFCSFDHNRNVSRPGLQHVRIGERPPKPKGRKPTTLSTKQRPSILRDFHCFFTPARCLTTTVVSLTKRDHLPARSPCCSSTVLRQCLLRRCRPRTGTCLHARGSPLQHQPRSPSASPPIVPLVSRRAGSPGCVGWGGGCAQYRGPSTADPPEPTSQGLNESHLPRVEHEVAVHIPERPKVQARPHGVDEPLAHDVPMFRRSAARIGRLIACRPVQNGVPARQSIVPQCLAIGRWSQRGIGDCGAPLPRTRPVPSPLRDCQWARVSVFKTLHHNDVRHASAAKLAAQIS